MKQKLKNWELEKGILIKKPIGFRGSRSEIYSRLYSEKAFKKGIEGSYISIKTQKGLEFLYSNMEGIN